VLCGGNDEQILPLNRQAMGYLSGIKRPRATHLFEEPGTLESVARLAAEWFLKHLAPA